MEQAGSSLAAQRSAAPGTAPQPSAHRPPPAGFAVPPSQPSTSGWVLSGPSPPLSAPESRLASESEFSEAESDVFFSSLCDLQFGTDLIYEVYPVSHRSRMLRVRRAVVLGPGSASLSLRRLVSASGSTQGSRR